jgi:hypothetical protein
MIIDTSKLNKKQLEEKLLELKNNKKGNLRKFFGKAKSNIDTVVLQKKMRNEWE